MANINEVRINKLGVQYSKRHTQRVRDEIVVSLMPWYQAVARRRSSAYTFDDHVQTMALHTLELLDRYDPEKGLLMQFLEAHVARNARHVERRLTQHRKEVYMDDIPTDVLEEVTAVDTDHEERMTTEQRAQDMYAAADDLNYKERLAFTRMTDPREPLQSDLAAHLGSQPTGRVPT